MNTPNRFEQFTKAEVTVLLAGLPFDYRPGSVIYTLIQELSDRIESITEETITELKTGQELYKRDLDKTLTDIYSEGVEAHAKGFKFLDNPYSYKHIYYCEWADGWQDSEDHINTDYTIQENLEKANREHKHYLDSIPDHDTNYYPDTNI